MSTALDVGALGSRPNDPHFNDSQSNTSNASDAGDAFRTRLLTALAASISERGYRATTVADIVRQARTSKRTFYDHFASKEECFIDLLRADMQAMIDGIRAGVDPQAPPDEQIRSAVGAYVSHIAAQRSITLSRIREAPGLGDVARRLHRLAMEQLTDMLVELSSSPGFVRAGLPPVSEQLGLILLGGLQELTASIVEDERDAQLIVEPAVTAATALFGPRN
jgi:AcrR family transcriptional regulator